MIFSSKFRTDSSKRTLDQVTADIHGYLTGLDDITFSGLGQQDLLGDFEIVTDCLLNLVYRQILLLISHNVTDNLLSQFNCHFLTRKGSMCDKGNQYTFQFTEIGFDLICKEFKDIF